MASHRGLSVGSLFVKGKERERWGQEVGPGYSVEEKGEGEKPLSYQLLFTQEQESSSRVCVWGKVCWNRAELNQ